MGHVLLDGWIFRYVTSQIPVIWTLHSIRLPMDKSVSGILTRICHIIIYVVVTMTREDDLVMLPNVKDQIMCSDITLLPETDTNY